MTEYWKTVITVTILSEHGPVSESCSLEQIAHEMSSGGWVGDVDITDREELTPQEVAQALVVFGSSPEFFDLDDDGLTAEQLEKYPLKDWQYEVANGDTTAGYADWVIAKSEADAEDAKPPPAREGLIKVAGPTRYAEQGNVRVTLHTETNEGLYGDYDPNDPEDHLLYRFDVDRKVDGQWVPVDDASYCTAIGADTTPPDKVQEYLDEIFNAVREAVENGQSVKKLCEKLSWLGGPSE